MKKTTADGDIELTEEEIACVLAAQADAQARKQSQAVAELWAAADRYVYKYINGVGLSILGAGAFAGKPKALACARWSDSIWAEYYVRKAAILRGERVSLDFSSFGEIPHKVIELRDEIAEIWISS